jgi:hypothetical protein
MPFANPVTCSLETISARIFAEHSHRNCLGIEAGAHHDLAMKAQSGHRGLEAAERSLEVVRTILNRAARAYRDDDGRPWP